MLLLLSLLLLSPLARASDADVADLVRCYSGLVPPTANAANNALGINDLSAGILVPGVRNGVRGIYIYTPGTSYFHAFPPADDENERNRYHYFEIRLPGKTATFAIYAEDKTTGEFFLTTSPGPNPAIRPYHRLEGGDALDASSRDALSRELRSRVVLVSPRYLVRLPQLERQHARARRELDAAIAAHESGESLNRAAEWERLTAAAVRELKERTRRALNACRIQGDPELAATAEAELRAISVKKPSLPGRGFR